MAKRITYSSSSGCGIYRESEGTIKVGLSEGSLEKNVSFFEDEETEKAPELQTSQYCGSVSPFNPGGTPLGKVSKNFPNINLTSSYVESEPNVDPDDHLPGLIVTTVAGYFYISPEEGTGKTPYGLSLGSSPNHALIVKSVGKVIKLAGSAEDKITGHPTRWAFEEGMRVHLHRIQQQPYSMIFSYFQGHSSTIPTIPAKPQYKAMPMAVAIPWYGYFQRANRWFNDVTGLMGWAGSCALLSGVAYQPNWIKWGKEFYLICEESKDYNYYSVSGMDESFFANKSVRLGRINFEMECNVSTVHSSNFNTMCRYYTNLIRNCEENVHVIVDDSSSVLTVAQNYAQNMADNQFMAHIDPNTGYDMVDRLENAGITDSIYVGEILCTVTDDEIDDEDEIPEIAVNDRWKTSADHFTVMIDSAFYKCSFGKAYDVVDNKWYCCGLFRTTEGDEDLVDSEDIIFPEAIKDVRNTYEDMAEPGSSSRPGALPHMIYSVYSAFSLVPEDPLNISALCYEVFSSSPWPFVTTVISVPDHHKRALYTTSNIEGPEEYGTIGSIKANYEQHESPGGFIANRGQAATAYRRFYEGDPTWLGGPGYTKFYIEYDHGTERKSVSLRLYDIISYVQRIDYSYWIDSDFTISDRPIRNGFQPHFRDTPMLVKSYDGTLEDEPDLGVGSSLRGGDTELYIGETYINNASDFSGGLHINPFQTINVMSVFHSNSGYTCVLYTRTKTLDNSWISWACNQAAGVDDPPDHAPGETFGSSERYWWLRQSLWCAVVDSSGFKIANFEVKGTKPQRSGEDVETNYRPWNYDYIQPNAVDTQIIIQAGGIIEEGSLEIWADHIEGEQIIIKERETESSFEFYVYSGDETKFSSCSVSLTTGEIIVEFSVPPDEGSKIRFYADVWEFDSVYAPIHHFSEHVCYARVEYYDSPITTTNFISFFEVGTSGVYGNNLKTISFDGLMPINPNVSITEDGKYLVIGMTIAWAKIPSLSGGRVPKGLTGNEDHPNWFGSTYLVNDPSINYDKESLTQIIVLDMSDINVSGEPKLLVKPFLFSQLKGQLTETMVLN